MANMQMAAQTAGGCSDAQGTLPACAPLANPYVPFQNDNPERYAAGRALMKGTLFPGLDLPYRGAHAGSVPCASLQPPAVCAAICISAKRSAPLKKFGHLRPEPIYAAPLRQVQKRPPRIPGRALDRIRQSPASSFVRS